MPSSTTGWRPSTISFVVDPGAHVFVLLRHAREREQHIQRLQRARRGAQARQRLFQRLADLAEELILEAHGVFLRAEYLALQILQFLGDEPLAVGERLLARVAIRHLIVKRARDFDVIAKHAVVTDLQVFDAGGLALAKFQFGEVILAVFGDIAQLIQLLVVAVADHAALAHGERGFVVDGAREQGAYILHGIERVRASGDEGRVAGGGVLFDQRHDLQRGAQGKAVAGIERVVGDAAQEALDVIDAAEGFAQGVGFKEAAGKALHGVQPRLDLPRVAERPFDPVAQEAAAHRRLRAVEYAQKRAALAAAVRRLRKFEALQGGAIQRHEARARVGAQLQYVRECVFLRLHQVGEQRARRADAEPLPFQTEVCNALAKVFLQTLGGARILKRLRVGRARALGALRHAGGQGRSVVGDDLSGVDARQLVRQRKAHVA